MSSRIKRATMTDVARKAGVSQTTVSFVLNGIEAGLPERTKQRVLEVVKELNYSPNDAARRLASKRSQSIGLAIYDISSIANYGQAAAVVFAAAYRAAEKKSYKLAIYTTREREQMRQDVDTYFTVPVRSNEVDGVIVWDYYVDQGKLVSGFRDGLPIVTLDRQVEEVPCVVPDYDDGISQIVETLVAKGHTRLCLVTYAHRGYRDIAVQSAFIAAAERAGLDRSQITTREARPMRHPERTDASLLLDSVFEEPNPPTAIVCAYDRFALSMLADLRKRGIDVPGEMAVVGCAGLPITNDEAYRLSTLNLHHDTMATHAVDMVIQMVMGKDLSGAKVLVQPQLIERSSS